jgi:hypothetical protein
VTKLFSPKRITGFLQKASQHKAFRDLTFAGNAGEDLLLKTIYYL